MYSVFARFPGKSRRSNLFKEWRSKGFVCFVVYMLLFKYFGQILFCYLLLLKISKNLLLSWEWKFHCDTHSDWRCAISLCLNPCWNTYSSIFFTLSKNITLTIGLFVNHFFIVLALCLVKPRLQILALIHRQQENWQRAVFQVCIIMFSDHLLLWLSFNT